jgi:hypothetical protein
MQAVDAATAPSAAPPTTEPSKARVAGADLGHRVAATPETLRRASAQAKVAGKSMWSPLAQFSSVLWLQVTGSFFLLIAAFFGQGLWTARGAMHLSIHTPEAEKFWVYAAAFGAFGYFGVSNFVRAWRRERAKS